MKLIYFLSVFLIGLALFISHRNNLLDLSIRYEKADVAIGVNLFTVDVADDGFKRDKGLGGRESLAPNEGMLFTFTRPAPRSFWMKGMLIPIDIVWISENKVIGVTENVDPEIDVPIHKLTRYRSPQEADMVLEIAAGEVKRLKIKVGDNVNVKFRD